MSDPCRCPGPSPLRDHAITCPASLYQAGIERGRAEALREALAAVRAADVTDPLKRPEAAILRLLSGGQTLHVWTADSEEWVVAASAEDAARIYCAHLGWTPDFSKEGEDGDYGTHPSHWTELPDDKRLAWAEECPEHHRAGETCPRGCDKEFLLHTNLTCGEHAREHGRGYLGSAHF